VLTDGNGRTWKESLHWQQPQETGTIHPLEGQAWQGLAGLTTACSSSSDPSLTTSVEKELPVVPRHRRILFQIAFVCKRLVRYWWAWELRHLPIGVRGRVGKDLISASYNPESSSSSDGGTASSGTVLICCNFYDFCLYRHCTFCYLWVIVLQFG